MRKKQQTKKEEKNSTENILGKKDETMTKTMTIEGMMCGHCTGRVQKALEAIEGVTSVEMSLENKTATVEVTDGVTDAVLTNAVTDAGYEVTKIQ